MCRDELRSRRRSFPRILDLHAGAALIGRGQNMPGYRKHFLAIPRRSGSDRAQSKQPIKARDFFLQEAEI